MKNVFVLIMIFTVIVSCKDDKKDGAEATAEEKILVAEPGKTLKQSDGLTAIHGKFLFVEDQNAAVLQTPTQMYSIVLDDNMKQLREQVEQYKIDAFTMVPVTIRGRIFEKDSSEEGWDRKIEIKEILKVSKPSPEENDVIKLGNK